MVTAGGGQPGLNVVGWAGDDGNLSFGVTGGYVNSEMHFNNVTDRTSFDAFNAGIYSSQQGRSAMGVQKVMTPLRRRMTS